MKIAIIGSAGTLGSCTTYTLALKGLADEIVLLDTNSNLLLAHLMDINTAITGIQNTQIWAGSDEDLHHSDIVLVVAGIPYQAASSHLDRLRGNLSLIREITQKIETYCPEAVVITATNPVDSINLGMFLMSTALNRKRLLGYDLNDSLRFRQAVAKEAKQRLKLEVPNMLKSYIKLGINRTAGWTSAAGISQMVESISADLKKVIPCSAVLDGEYGYKGISMGVPVILGRQGIDRIIELDLAPDEQRDLHHNARELEAKARLVKEFVSENK